MVLDRFWPKKKKERCLIREKEGLTIEPLVTVRVYIDRSKSRNPPQYILIIPPQKKNKK